MKYIFIIIILSISNLSFAQCKCSNGTDSTKGDKPFYSFKIDNQQIIFCGNKEKETKNFIFASEFDVINCGNKNILLKFGALQNCKIEKTKNELNIIETKRLPFGNDFSWIETNYIQYKIITNNKLSIDTIIILKTPKLNKEQGNKILSTYSSIKNKKSKITEGLIYQFLLLALNGNNEAKDILLNLKQNLNLDGYLAELNTDAISNK